MECGYNNYPSSISYPRVYPNFPTAMPSYYASNLVPPNGAFPAPVAGIPGIHGNTMASLNPEMPYFPSEIAAQPFAAMNAVASMAMSSAPHLDSSVALNAQNPLVSRSNNQAQRSTRFLKDDAPVGKLASLQTTKAASEGSEPSPGSGIHRPVGAPFDAGGSDSSNQCAAGPGSLASIGLKEGLVEDVLNQKVMAVLRSPTVVSFLREHQRRLYQQRREKSIQERSSIPHQPQQHQQHQSQQHQQQQPLATNHMQLTSASCGQVSPAHSGYVPANSGQMHPFPGSHQALNNLTDSYSY